MIIENNFNVELRQDAYIDRWPSRLFYVNLNFKTTSSTFAKKILKKDQRTQKKSIVKHYWKE